MKTTPTKNIVKKKLKDSTGASVFKKIVYPSIKIFMMLMLLGGVSLFTTQTLAQQKLVGDSCSSSDKLNPNTECKDGVVQCKEGEKDDNDKLICKDGRWVCNRENKKICCGIKLNTNVPFIGRCIMNGEITNQTDDTTQVNQLTAFPILMGGLTKIMMTLILAISFLLVIAGGVLMIVGGANQEYYKKGTKLIRIVIITIATIGVSGIVLRLINPNFFGI